MREQIGNLLKPENRRYIPLAALGIVKGLAAMAIRELSGPEKLPTTPASLTFYTTGEGDETVTEHET